MIAYNTLIVLMGTCLLGASAGLVGSYAVLRRRSLTGDALAHAALPGLCLAFIISGQRSLPVLLAGALISGLLGIGVISALRRWTKIKEDAAIGIVLSVFFGVGVALSRSIQNLSTAGSKAGLDSYILGKTAGMVLSDVLWIGGLAAGCLILIVLCYKEFQLLSFDSGFAQVQGWPVILLDLLLMGMIAVAVTIGLPAVGVVLMASLLILPGAAARFWTYRLDRQLLLSAVFGGVIGWTGTAISASLSLLPAGPIIVLTGTAVFLTSMLFAPNRGVVAEWLRERTFQNRLAIQKLLCEFYELVEQTPAFSATISPAELLTRRSWSSSQLSGLLNQLSVSGDLELWATGQVMLKPKGLKHAAELVCQRRLWALVLAEHPEWGNALVNIDRPRLSDHLPMDLCDQLEKELRSRGQWPRILDEMPADA